MIRTLVDKYFPSNSVSYNDYLKLKLEMEYLQIKYDQLHKEYKFSQTSHRDIPVMGFDDLNAEPPTGKKRDKYVADVVSFHDNVLHKKLKTSIAEIRELLSNIGRQEGTPLNMPRVEYDMFLRGMEAFAWKIHDWAMNLKAEQIQALQDKENNNG